MACDASASKISLSVTVPTPLLITFTLTPSISIFSKLCFIASSDPLTSVLITIFIGGFAFHILWEAKSRYIIPYILVLIPISTIVINKK